MVITAAVVVVAVVHRGAGPARTPSTPEAVVRAYVQAYADQDAATACRLSSVAAGSWRACRDDLRLKFAFYAKRKLLWRDPRLASVHVARSHGLLRAEVVVRYEPARGGAIESRLDTWWLRSEDGAARMVRASILDSLFFGQDPGVAGSDRPLTEAEVAGPAKLSPALACGRTRRAIPIGRVAIRDAFRHPVKAGSLSLSQVQDATTPGGARCLRLRTRVPWRSATLINLRIATRPASRLSGFAQLRIGSDGRLSQNGTPDLRFHAGASRGQVAVVLPHALDHRDLTIAITTVSAQLEEPLLSHPINAWEKEITLHLPALPRGRGRPAPVRGTGHVRA